MLLQLAVEVKMVGPFLPVIIFVVVAGLFFHLSHHLLLRCVAAAAVLSEYLLLNV